MLTVLTVILVFGLLIFFHELGHLIVAKLCGMKVESFSIGFGTELFTVKLGETNYHLSLLPLGGYMAPSGPDFLEDVNPNDSEKERYFVSKPVWQRFLAIAAGPVFNLLFAAVLTSGMIYHFGGINDMTSTIEEVLENSPAAKAGVQKGDRIVAINKEKVRDWRDVFIFIQEYGSQDLKLRIERNKKILDVIVAPELREQRLIVGILPVVVKKEISGFLPAAYEGVRQVGADIRFQSENLIRLVRGKISRKNLGGPVMIFKVTGQAAQMGWIPLLNLIILLNIALGIFNLLPIPVLDGGRLLPLLIELVRGKPLSKNVQEVMLAFGFGLLILLIFFATYNDILRLLEK